MVVAERLHVLSSSLRQKSVSCYLTSLYIDNTPVISCEKQHAPWHLASTVPKYNLLVVVVAVVVVVVVVAVVVVVVVFFGGAGGGCLATVNKIYLCLDTLPFVIRCQRR